MDRFSDFITYDHSSVQATLVCVVFFWMLITVIAILTRRFLLHLSDKQPELFSCSQSYHSTPWGQFLYVWTNKVHLNHSLLLALLDSVATFEVCACSLECWTVREVVGKTGLLIAIAANGIRGLLFTCRDAYGNPCTPLYRYLKGRTSAMWVGITWGMQIIAAFLALHVAQIWWSFRPTIYHASRYKLALEISSARFSSVWPKPNSFQSDLRVSTWLGFLIETTGVFVDFALASVFACAIGRWNKHHQNSVFCSAVACSDTSFLSNRDASDECRADYHALLTPSRLQFWSSFALRLSISLFLTAKWIGLTGLYVNPANAFIQSWGLGDVSSWSHICVYWLGPFCGVWLSTQFERWLTQFMPEGSDSVISQLPKTPRVATLATQTVQETADLTETNSETSTSRRGLSSAQWFQNVRLRCLFSPIFDPHSAERETSPDITVNGFNLVSRFTRSVTRSTDAIR